MEPQLDLERPAGPNGAAVLLCTGAMNPAHKGHLQMLEQARARLEQAGIAVLGAFASPTHDEYVLGKALKKGTVGLSGAFRMEVLRLTVANAPLVNASDWEVTNPRGFVDYPFVVAEMSEWLHGVSEARGDYVYGIYVCGSDLANTEDLWSTWPDRYWGGVVVVPRTGDVLKGEEDPSRHVFVAAPDDSTAAFSSTDLRAAIARGDSDAVEEAMSPSAARFLMRPTRAEYERFAIDYAKLGVPDPDPPPRAPLSPEPDGTRARKSRFRVSPA